MHRGLKRFKGLHFGVNSTAEILREVVRKILQHEQIAISVYNGILVLGSIARGTRQGAETCVTTVEASIASHGASRKAV